MSLLSLSKRILRKDEGEKKKTSTQKKHSPKSGNRAFAGSIKLFEVVSEKSIVAGQEGVAVFRVAPDATKFDITRAVQETYGAHVLRVRTARMTPKNRRRGHTVGKTNAWKKAYVRVSDISAIHTSS